MTQHTPGPWSESYKYSLMDCLVVVAHSHLGSSAVALVEDRIDGAQKANARLIAAAPEMLALIKAYMEIPCRGISDNEDCDDENLCGPCNRAVTARALLARITGEKT